MKKLSELSKEESEESNKKIKILQEEKLAVENRVVEANKSKDELVRNYISIHLQGVLYFLFIINLANTNKRIVEK